MAEKPTADQPLLRVSVNWRLFLSLLPRALPSWLLSLVFHLSLVLLLALWHVAGGGTQRGVELLVGVDSGAEALGDEGLGALENSLSVASELRLPDTEAQSEPAAELTTERPAELPQFDLPGIAALAHGGGASAGGTEGGDEGEGAAGVGPTRTSVFGLVGEGSTFVYVFDRSDSMNSVFSYTSEGRTLFSVTPLEAAKAELLGSLADLDKRQRFHIIFYNHEPWLFDPGRAPNKLIQGSRANKRRAAGFVQSVFGQGNTNHMKPLEIALKLKPEVIFLLTDGEPKDDLTEYQLRQIARLNDGGTRINVIQFCFVPRSDTGLVRLAQENGGQHTFINIARLGPGMRGLPVRPSAPGPDIAPGAGGAEAPDQGAGEGDAAAGRTGR